MTGRNVFDFFSKTLNGFVETPQEARTQCPLPKFVFRADGKTRWPPDLWSAETILTSFRIAMKQNLPNLDRKEELKVLYKVCVFRDDRKKRPPWPLIGWISFVMFPETVELNFPKLDRIQEHTILYRFVFFWSNQKQDDHPCLWLAEHFQLFIWNFCIELEFDRKHDPKDFD